VGRLCKAVLTIARLAIAGVPRLNLSNRPVRTRMPAGVAGAQSQWLAPIPITRPVALRGRLVPAQHDQTNHTQWQEGEGAGFWNSARRYRVNQDAVVGAVLRPMHIE
jgi:hypothetical protein